MRCVGCAVVSDHPGFKERIYYCSTFRGGKSDDDSIGNDSFMRN